MSISKIIVFLLLVIIVLFYLVSFNSFAFAQVENAFDASSSSEAVTSVNDAILKSLVIISQVAVFGIIFNCFLFSKFLKQTRKGGNNKPYYSMKQDVYINTRILKKVSFIVIVCSVSIVFFSTCIILLQSYQLSQNLELDIYSAFDILFTTSVGQVWLLRIGTSSAIIALMIILYYLSRLRERAISNNSDNLGNHTTNRINHSSDNKLSQIFLLVVMIISSINLYSNSMVSHSNSLPSYSTLAVSMDWIHFMAVSIWIGGLFYLSLILTRNIKPVDYDSKSNSTIAFSSTYDDIKSVHNLSIYLMNFSFVAIIALCVIGVSGLYLGYVHLQNLNSVFSTSYGQLLVLKLGLAFPLIFIGRYNQLKIFEYTSLISNLIKNMDDKDSNAIDIASLQYQENRTMMLKSFCRTLKVESILGIAVLIVASFLSVTSPPSLEVFNGFSDDIQTQIASDSRDSSFIYLVITLAVIIFVIAVVNFRKNQKQIEKIFAIVDGGF